MMSQLAAMEDAAVLGRDTGWWVPWAACKAVKVLFFAARSTNRPPGASTGDVMLDCVALVRPQLCF